MKLSYQKSSMVRVSDIEIPDVFFRRMHTRIEVIDKLFGGEGILPGMVFTLSAAAGVGKTTLMLQICEALADQGYEAGYVTGEETTTMLAYSCRRLGLKSVQVCHETDVEEICEMMKQMDFLIIDSFATLQFDDKRMSDGDAINKIVSAAKEHECAVGIILHQTKNGNFKGSTVITHAVDCNIAISINDESDDHRDIQTSKNRYGTPYSGVLRISPSGYDLSALADMSAFTTASSKSKKSRKEDQILSMKEPPNITIDRVVQELNVSEAYARQMLYKLNKENKLVKIGSGSDAIWKFPINK
jgi:DNA repair protein RadA/Sms